MSKYNYSNGYVVFADILGFSNLFDNSKNKSIDYDLTSDMKKLFDVINGISELFNKNQRLGVKMLFGSDSIFLSTENEDFFNLLTPLEMLVKTVYEELGLLIRGGIAKGEFYHDETNIFGPAVVAAVALEKRAKYSRIILQDKIVKGNERIVNDLCEDIFADYDGEYCINFYSIALFNTLEWPVDISKYSFNNLFDIAINNLGIMQSKILDICQNHIYDSNFFKYAWQIIPFNVICHKFIDDIHSIQYFCDFPESLSADQKERVQSLIINDLWSN